MQGYNTTVLHFWAKFEQNLTNTQEPCCTIGQNLSKIGKIRKAIVLLHVCTKLEQNWINTQGLSLVALLGTI